MVRGHDGRALRAIGGRPADLGNRVEHFARRIGGSSARARTPSRRRAPARSASSPSAPVRRPPHRRARPGSGRAAAGTCSPGSRLTATVRGSHFWGSSPAEAVEVVIASAATRSSRITQTCVLKFTRSSQPHAPWRVIGRILARSGGAGRRRGGGGPRAADPRRARRPPHRRRSRRWRTGRPGLESAPLIDERSPPGRGVRGREPPPVGLRSSGMRASGVLATAVLAAALLRRRAGGRRVTARRPRRRPAAGRRVPRGHRRRRARGRLLRQRHQPERRDLPRLARVERDQVLELWQPPRAGNNGRGIDVDDAGRVYVAGGPAAEVRVFARSGALLAELPTGAAGSFLNDLWVGPDGAAYVTDSSLPVIWRVSLGRGGWRIERWLDVSPEITYTPSLTDFDLGGIVSTNDRRYLLDHPRHDGPVVADRPAHARDRRGRSRRRAAGQRGWDRPARPYALGRAELHPPDQQAQARATLRERDGRARSCRRRPTAPSRPPSASAAGCWS